jgi:peptide/nickel transport system substrate-binding protein
MLPNKRWSALLAVLAIITPLVAGCGATAAPQPTTQAPTQAAQQPTEAVMAPTATTQVAVPTAAPTEAPTAVPAAGGAVKRGGVLKWARQALPISLDPVWTDSNYDIWLFPNMYEGLVRVDKTGTSIEPSLATSWDISQDQLTYTFHLRPGVKFHDGSELKASDVVWSLDRARDPEAGIWNWTLENVDKVEAVDDATVAITLKVPAANFLNMLTMFNSSILPGELVDAQGKDAFFKAPIGTGPFKMAEYVVGDHLTFVKNPDYWEPGEDGQPLPYLDEVHLVQVPEASTRVLQVQSGDVDGTDQLPFSMINQLKSDTSVNVQLFRALASQFGWLNHRKPPLDDVNVRLALNYAIDRQALIDTVLFGNGEVATSFRAKGSTCWDSSLPGFPYDLEKAKQLMAESNYPDGFQGLLVTVASGDAMTRDIATVLKEMWAQIGIDVTIQEMETGSWYDEYDEEQFMVQIGGWTDDTIDPIQETEYMAVDPAGRTGWTNDRVIELAKAAATELDQSKRCEMYDEIQKIYNDEAVEVLLFNTSYTVLTRPAVSGFTQSPLGWLIWRTTWLNQ